MKQKTMVALAVVIITVLSLFLARNFISAHAQETDRRLRPVSDVVREARAVGRNEVTLPQFTLSVRAFDSLDDALNTYTLVEAVLREERTIISGPDSGRLQTYLRFEPIQTFAGPPVLDGSMPDHVPQDLRNIQDADFLVVVPASGEIAVDNVRIKSASDRIKSLVIGRKYVMFVDMRTLHFGSFPFGVLGVFAVASDDSLVPVSLDGNQIADAFRKASLHSGRDVQVFGASHVHARPLHPLQ